MDLPQPRPRPSDLRVVVLRATADSLLTVLWTATRDVADPGRRRLLRTAVLLGLAPRVAAEVR